MRQWCVLEDSYIKYINILLSKLLQALPEDLDDAGGVQLGIFDLNSNVLRAVYESEVRTAVPRVEDEEL